jgi:translocation and assembly module TamB
MATVDVSRSHKHQSHRAARVRKKKSHAFRNGVIFLLLVLCVALYFAPAIVAHTPLRNSLPQAALKLDGTITIDSASLGWFSGVVADHIQLRDAAGDVVIEVGQVRTEKPLIGLLLDFGNVGRVEVDKPSVHAVCREQDTNLERLFAEMLRTKSDTKVAAHLKINDGTLVIDDEPTGRTFRIEKLGVDCTIADAQQPIVLAASGSLLERRQPGEFKIELRSQRSADGKNPLAGGKIDCSSTAIPLELAEPLVRRYVERAQLGGRLSTRLSGAWGTLADSGQASVQGEALVTDLDFAAAALGKDRVRLARVEVPCHLVQNGDLLEVQQLAVRCELGNVSLSGSAKMSDFSDTDMLAALVRENYKLDGALDLVQVARVLPETLRIREGTEITSGNVRLAVASHTQNGESAWSGQIDASHLGAQANGRALVWENPLAIDFTARQTADGIVVDKAECTSSFLHASAAGSIHDLTAAANFDLARLVAELSQFADLSQLELAGQGEAKLTLKRADGDRFTADGDFQVQGFQFVPIAGGQPWREDRLRAEFDLSGQLDHANLKRVDRAMLSVEAGSERAIAQLREPIVDPFTTAWPVQCSWRGNLAAWTPRLQGCLGITGWDLRGTGTLQAVAICSRKRIDVEQAQADFAQLQVWGHEWFINEPAASLSAQGRYDLEKARAEIAEAKLTAGSTSAIVRRAVLQAAEEGWKVDGGTAQIGADLVTFYRWRHDPRLPAAWRVYGRLAAEADLKYDASVTTARVNGTIEQLKLVEITAPGAGTDAATWQEPRITLAALASYHHASEQLHLDNVQVVSAALRCDAGGSMPLSNQGGDVDIKGTIQYDWQELAPLWRPYLGSSVQIAGRQVRKFAMRGRLTGSPIDSDSWRQMTGEAAVGWTGVNLSGFQIGQGEIAARLVEGQLRTDPIDVPVSDGRITFSPLVQVIPGPMELYIPRGPLLTNIHLSPEMCKRGLKFVAPIVAETTVAEGRFSITMDGGRIPLADPKGGDMAGHMAIRAQVKPGPVAQEFLVLVNQLFSVVQRGNFQPLDEQAGALMSIDTTDVEFRMVNRRVYHRNLKFTVGTLPITTHGSVGMDESLSMVAEVPLRANLFGRDLSLGTLEGQALQIPIGGTLKKPKIDQGVLRQLTGQLLQNVTRGALLDEFNKQLERLNPFQPQPQQ